jgi:hypothetical protein
MINNNKERKIYLKLITQLDKYNAAIILLKNKYEIENTEEKNFPKFIIPDYVKTYIIQDLINILKRNLPDDVKETNIFIENLLQYIDEINTGYFF